MNRYTTEEPPFTCSWTGAFLYRISVKGARNMEGYDNDVLLLMLDDDLFPAEEEDEGGEADV